MYGLKVKRVMFVAFVLLCMSCTNYGYPPIFRTIPEFEQYSREMQEYPPIDNTTWANPDYTSFLSRYVPGWWDRLLQWLHISSWPLWHIQGFKDLLIKITQFRESNGLFGRFILSMKPLPGSMFFIWGDVQGAYHSLVRALSYLKDRGVIDENLEINSPYTYFIFTGDLINRSAYSLEALTVVMRLMEKNPHKIFYIRGNHEDRGHWKNFNLKRDLELRARAVSSSQTPLETEIDAFFNTLPLALYLVGQESENEMSVVRISHFNRSVQELQESAFSGFFKNSDEKVRIFKLGSDVEPLSQDLVVSAIIKGESRSTVYRPTVGLAQLEADQGSTAWTILSSPTEAYRHLQDFYLDAFVLLRTAENFDDWKMTLYNQDVRELLGFQEAGVYNLTTGLREFTEGKKSEEDPFVDTYRKLKQAKSSIEALQKSCVHMPD